MRSTFAIIEAFVLLGIICFFRLVFAHITGVEPDYKTFINVLTAAFAIAAFRELTEFIQNEENVSRNKKS